jgi:hypothetical protein
VRWIHAQELNAKHVETGAENTRISPDLPSPLESFCVLNRQKNEALLDEPVRLIL